MCKILKENYKVISGVIFLVVGVGHAVRAILGWPLIVGAWNVPAWISVVAAIVILSLAWTALRK
jgi:hypothetical protein